MSALLLHPWELYPAGTLITAAPGYSTVYPDFDFETFSAAGFLFDHQRQKWGSLPGYSTQNRGLKMCGTVNYVRHPSFRLLSLAWNLKDGRGPRWWIPEPHPQANDVSELIEHIRSGKPLEAFNVFFEWMVWELYCVPKLGWPSLYLEQLRCCMAKARAAAYPGSLGDVCDVLYLHERKDPRGDKLVKKLTVPRSPTKANRDLIWTPITAAQDFKDFYEYNRQDIRSEGEASNRIPDLSPREMDVWRFDLLCNARGMQVDRVAIDNLMIIAEQCFERYNAELFTLTNGVAKNSSEVAKILTWMRSRGVSLYNLDEDSIEEALLRTDYPADVLRVVRIRQMLSFGSVKKLWAFKSHSTPEGRLHDQYIYYGAHTSLWNGRAVQPANLYSGIFKKPAEVERALEIMSYRALELVEFEYPDEDPLEIVASCLRSLIISKYGHRLISADFTAIQAVATSALAGEEWRLEVFRTHGKIYEAMAAMLTGKTLQFYLDYRKEHGKHHPDRQLGKLAVLSADFGAWIKGWMKFGAGKYGDEAFIKQLILKTRNAIPSVCEFWGGQTRNKFDRAPDGSYAQEHDKLYGLEGAAISAILEPGRCFGFRGISYEVYEDVLYCRPPSGGLIRYHHPKLSKSMREYARPWELEMSYEGWNSNATKGRPGWTRMKLYGGVQTQNVVSHTCREIQANALLALERNGYPIVMHTHDEQVAEVPDGYGSKEHFTQIVRDSLPSWARTPDGQPWPVKVPMAWEERRYGKWED